MRFGPNQLNGTPHCCIVRAFSRIVFPRADQDLHSRLRRKNRHSTAVRNSSTSLIRCPSTRQTAARSGQNSAAQILEAGGVEILRRTDTTQRADFINRS